MRPMIDGFQQSYYVLELVPRTGPRWNFANRGLVCQLIHVDEYSAELITQDPEKLTVKELRRTKEPVALKCVQYLLCARSEGSKEVLREEFYHPFESPVFLKQNVIYSTEVKLFKRDDLNHLLQTNVFKPNQTGTQFIA